jgi:hypothetical protein
MYFKTFPVALLSIFFGCNSITTTLPEESPDYRGVEKENPYHRISEIPLPAGYERIASPEGSFADWLAKVPLKKDRTVYKYDGTPKTNQQAQFAVLDISVGNKDLQQCADAVMRLRAEYLFSQNEFDEIVFFDNDGKPYKFGKPFTRDNFIVYLDRVFGMCGTASLSKQLNAVNKFNDIVSGDVLIRGGFPGHAVIVMDVAINKSGKKVYLLAQGYMPAQDIHVLVNPSDETLSPWFFVSDDDIIQTPEYTFRKNELKRW